MTAVSRTLSSRVAPIIGARSASTEWSRSPCHDGRTDHEEPTWIGTIRGGYGNPPEALHATKPVGQVVGEAFVAVLARWGLNAGLSGDQLNLAIG
ncbi:hypothetical protein [Siccirubricoccus deserti]|uniref:Uncharacterized protein n=1 Tax=Siccirubricoccus deserti TaxID=2013562 RepID=A0A9X0R4W6_9PROT|nr:hypothetical protein [Siccirubricoccus deserti]MBC4018467.1 hypothetical protein [Siccirubricoccus deserti]